MTQHPSILEAFVKLGTFLSDYVEAKKNAGEFKPSWEIELEQIVSRAKHHNGWFTEGNMLFALKSWSEQLTKKNLTAWLSNYDLSKNQTKKVAIIMAGNIPLVGFHDFLCVFISGHKAKIKLSDKDKFLVLFIFQTLLEINPGTSLKT